MDNVPKGHTDLVQCAIIPLTPYPLHLTPYTLHLTLDQELLLIVYYLQGNCLFPGYSNIAFTISPFSPFPASISNIKGIAA